MSWARFQHRVPPPNKSPAVIENKYSRTLFLATVIEKPSLTTKLRFKLSHAWDPVLTTMPRRLSTTINPANQPSGTDSSNHHDGSGAVPQSVEGL